MNDIQKLFEPPKDDSFLIEFQIPEIKPEDTKFRISSVQLSKIMAIVVLIDRAGCEIETSIMPTDANDELKEPTVVFEIKGNIEDLKEIFKDEGLDLESINKLLEDDE